MITCATRFDAPAICLLAASLLLPAPPGAAAGTPSGARYCATGSDVFWFVHVSDPHIGARGSTDGDRLRWVVTTGRAVIAPEFIVVTGDLTDSTNGSLFGIPNGPHQAEWDEYRGILEAAGAGADVLYDLPGNHDAYSDATFAYYRDNSVQGRATGRTQLSWTRTFPFGTYHFLGVNSADNTGAPFSFAWPWGDYAGLDATELAFVNQELQANAGARLTLVFGHHPLTDTGSADDTWLYYGHRDFVGALDAHGASLYGYGHTHSASQAIFAGDAYTGLMAGGGVFYGNVASLGKSSSSNFSVVAVDCDGLSAVTQATATWPVVLITAPVAKSVGATANPYAYTVPIASANPIRALVFDAGTVSQVSYRVDGAAVWSTMTRVPGSAALWEALWNASALAPGDHTIEVRATGTTTRSHTITVEVTGTPVNHPPQAANDAYSTPRDTTLTVGAPGVLANDSDADGDAFTAHRVGGPTHGTLSLDQTGAFVYTPASGYTGGDAFSYVARDATGESNVATVALSVTAPPQADTVTVKSASYATKTKRLTVEATSSAQPAAVLTVVGYGQMTWKSKTRTYTLQVTVTPAPATVTVTSSLGGTATKTVTTK